MRTRGKKTKLFVIVPGPLEKHGVGADVDGSPVAKEGDVGTLRGIFEEFIGRTTIPGLSQLSGSKGTFAKSCWIFLFFVGICMAIYQSRSLIDEYRRYAVLERSSREMQWRIPFPAATICANYPVRWTDYKEEPGKTLVKNVREAVEKEKLQNGSGQKINRDEYALEEKVLYENLLKLNESQRQGLSVPTHGFLISCTWGEIECQRDMTSFNTLYYGNCFTFNPGFDQNNLLMASKSETLNIILRSDFEDAYPDLERDGGLTLLVHPPGSAPVLDDRRVYNLYPGRWLKLGVTMTEFNRLKAPYTSECVDSEARDSGFRSLYNTPSRPYIYTVEACTDSCLQNMSIRLCDCVVPYLPVPDKFPFGVCARSGMCDSVKEDELDTLCTCRKSCMDRSYAIRVDVDDRWLTQRVWVQWVKDSLSKDTKESLNMSTVTGFELYVATTLFETIKEEPKISWADFLGSIGGNLGLWVGISIISMVELLELLTSILALAARSLSKNLGSTD